MPRFEQVNENFLPRNEMHGIQLPSFLKNIAHSWVKDPRDNLMAEFVIYYAIFAVVPFWSCYLIPAVTPYSPLYLVFWLLTLQANVLHIHFTTHVNVWKPECQWVQWVVSNIYSPMIGLPPELYSEHHTKMHHVDNNGPGDLSGTERYERDNVLHWLIYWARHCFLAMLELPIWSLERGRTKRAFLEAVGASLYFVVFFLAYKVNPTAASWTLIIPFFVSTVLFMLGNWSQHVLVNPKNARSSYGLAYNIINAKVNLGFWNDGYHLMHHLNSQTTWHQLPNVFLANQDKIAQKGGLTFTDTVYQKIFYWAVTGQIDQIHAHFVPLSEEQEMNLEEFKVFIDEWFRPIYEKGAPETWLHWFLKATSRREPAYIDYVATEKKY